MSSDNKRVLVLGCGSIGERHIRCLTSVGGADIIACDTRPDRLTAMKELYGVADTVVSYEEADLGDVDAVMVCTPTDQHIEPAMKAARAGCHLFIEKPISNSLDGVDELLTFCRDREILIQMGYVMRHHPNLKEIKALLDIDKIGKINMCQIKSGYFIGKYRPEYAQLYWAHKATGGGVIWDASHQQDWVQWLMGPITQVAAMTEHFMLDIDEDVEDSAVMMLRFASGALGSVSMSNCQQNYKSGVELNGEKGSIEWSYANSEVRIYTEDDQSWRSHSSEYERDVFFVNQARSFMESITGAARVPVTGEDGRRALMVSLAAYESAQTGKVVHIDPCAGCG